MTLNEPHIPNRHITMLRVSAALLLVGGLTAFVSGIVIESWGAVLAGALMFAGGMVIAFSARTPKRRAEK